MLIYMPSLVISFAYPIWSLLSHFIGVNWRKGSRILTYESSDLTQNIDLIIIGSRLPYYGIHLRRITILAIGADRKPQTDSYGIWNFCKYLFITEYRVAAMLKPFIINLISAGLMGKVCLILKRVFQCPHVWPTQNSPLDLAKLLIGERYSMI